MADKKEIAEQKLLLHRLVAKELTSLFKNISSPPDQNILFPGASKHKNLDLGVSSTKNSRSYQEDRFDWDDELPGIEDLEDEEITDILKNTAIELDSSLPKPLFLQGSTLNTTIFHNGKIYTANSGDSSAALIILDSNGNVTVSKRLNGLHNPTENAPDPNYAYYDPTKDQQGKKPGKYKDEIRIFPGEAIPRLAGIALYNSIGDRLYREIFHKARDPDTFVNDVKIPEGGQAFLLNRSDGLTDAFPDETDIADFISKLVKATKEDRKITATEIAHALVTEAQERGSQDNITCLVRHITPSDKTSTITAVYDGHGGEGVVDD